MNILQVSTMDYGGGAEKSAWGLFLKYREQKQNSWLAVGRKLSDDPDVFEIPKAQTYNSLVRCMFSFLDRRLNWFDRGNIKVASLRKSLRKAASGTATIQSEIAYRLGIENFSFPGTWNLLQLTPQPPEIIHLHNLHGDYFDLRYLPRLSQNIPVILNLRDMWNLTGHCAYPLGCARWQNGCGKCPDLTIYPPIRRDATRLNHKRKEMIFFKSKIYITTPTQWLMRQVHTSNMFRAIDYRVIPNAIDTQLFQPGDKGDARQKLSLPANAKIVLMIAHSQFKDLQTMRNAVARLTSGDTPLLFLCIGIQKNTEPLGEGEMIYLGRIREQVEMALYYQAADIYIHAAHNEVFGRTIIEAMSCAVPVVATAVDGIPELIVDEVTGFLTPGKDDEAMANRIQYLLDRPSRAIEIGQKAFQDVKKRYDLDVQAKTFLNWYREIIDARNAFKL